MIPGTLNKDSRSAAVEYVFVCVFDSVLCWRHTQNQNPSASPPQLQLHALQRRAACIGSFFLYRADTIPPHMLCGSAQWRNTHTLRLADNDTDTDNDAHRRRRRLVCVLVMLRYSRVSSQTLRAAR